MAGPSRKDFVSGRWRSVRRGADSGPLIPGLLVRRSQQAHTSLWAMCVPEDITIQQFAILRILAEDGQTQQTTLGRLAALDRSNTADVLSRLRGRKLVTRAADPEDKRRNLWSLTSAGKALYERTRPHAAITTELLLAPLVGDDRKEFLRLLTILVDEAERRVQQHNGDLHHSA